MSSHALVHAVNINADPAKVHAALTTLDGLKGWTAAEVSGGGKVGAQWSLHYAGGPAFVWEIAEQNAGRVVWKCVKGPGESVGTTVTFDLHKTADGRVQLKFAHGGWPHQEGNFAKCNALWGMMLHHLRAFAERGKIAPAHS